MTRARRVDDNQIVGNCRHCGKGCPPGSCGRTRIYCSRMCTGKAVGKNGNARIRNPPAHIVCKWCGEQFETYHRGKQFCSKLCSYRGKMRPRTGRGRVDKNQNDIVQMLRQVGASVLITSDIGIPGFPDLVVGFRGRNYLLEVKNPENWYGRKGFNDNQQEWSASWAGAAPIIVRTPDEALAAIGAMP